MEKSVPVKSRKIGCIRSKVDKTGGLRGTRGTKAREGKDTIEPGYMKKAAGKKHTYRLVVCTPAREEVTLEKTARVAQRKSKKKKK